MENWNKHFVGVNQNCIIITAPKPRYSRDDALNLVAWIGVLLDITPKEYQDACDLVSGRGNKSARAEVTGDDDKKE